MSVNPEGGPMGYVEFFHVWNFMRRLIASEHQLDKLERDCRDAWIVTCRRAYASERNQGIPVDLGGEAG